MGKAKYFGCVALGLIAAGLVLTNFGVLRVAGVLFGLAIIFGAVFVKRYLEYLRKSGKFRVFLGRLLDAVFRGFGRAADVFKPIGRKLGAGLRRLIPRNPLRLTVFKDEKLSLFSKRGKRRVSPYRRMKWKDLKDDTDRVRFVYYNFMAKRIKRGFAYRPSQTPREVCDELWREGGQGAFNEAELFDMYNVYRYKQVKTDGQAEKLRRFT